MKLRKMTLNINGADRMFICDPEKDTLATVVRRLGLTGTKVGCGTGVCGSCSIILNGKVIRSCTKKIQTIEEYSTVTTIEGIGSPNYLHPLQVAWMQYGGVQCGFCTPGFIVSAYALLDENKNPSREDVRDWFQKHRNICRCTGYKQIVDAVMAAAKVLRGECSIDDIRIDKVEDGEYYGKPMVRPAALAKVCGVSDFGDDIELKMPSSTLHVVMVQPKVAHHAKILSINTAEAEKMPGVYKIITHKDVKGSNRLCFFQFNERCLATEQTHILLAEDKIFNYGDIVALVAADTKQRAQEAAKKVTIEFEQLPEYLNYLEAAMPDAMRIHDDHPNVWCQQPTIKGDDVPNIPQMIDDADHIVEGSFYSSREPHMSIEGDTVQAYWGDDGMLTVHCKAMAIYANVGDIAEATGVPDDKVRVVENPTGGTFGWGIASATYSLAAIACLACDDMPVAFSMTYDQFMAFSGKRAPAYTNTRLACNNDGKIVGAEWDCGLDHGAYNELGDDLTWRPARFMYFPYNVPNVYGLSRVACTNHSYGTAYRGYGSPQAYTASEAVMDMMAEKLGMDPFEFRWKNIARQGDLNINSYPYVNYPMEEIMKQMKPIYDKAVADAKAADTPEIRRGVGIAWGGYNVTEGAEDQSQCAIELRADGKFVKYDTWQDQGQGGDVGSLQCTLKALQPLGVTPDDIVLIQNDSKTCPDSGASASSRQHYMNGKTSTIAADQLMNAMRKPDGTYRTYDEMVAEGIPTKYHAQYENVADPDLCGIDANTGVGNPTPDYTYCLHVAEVEVNAKTGKTTVIAFHCVDDVGVIGNPVSVDGQAYGGLSHCIGFALSENYDDVKKHNNIAGAGIPTIKDIPDEFNIHHIVTPRKKNPFGSSGASEAFQSSGHMAVVNAIYNACGVRIHELPATAGKVKAGLEAIAAGKKPEAPKKYFLGSDFYEEMEYIRNNPV
ncbi:MAG: molybdopterin cofactor-binding domain-containing protein [Anaerovoracaceae bacterium]